MLKLITSKILWLLSSLLIINSLEIQAEVGEPTVNVITTTLINMTGTFGSAIELETEAESTDKPGQFQLNIRSLLGQAKKSKKNLLPSLLAVKRRLEVQLMVKALITHLS